MVFKTFFNFSFETLIDFKDINSAVQNLDFKCDGNQTNDINGAYTIVFMRYDCGKYRLPDNNNNNMSQIHV